MQAGGRYAVYIMASRRNGTLYVGVTNNIALRAYQHRTGAGGEFTRKYGVTRRLFAFVGALFAFVCDEVALWLNPGLAPGVRAKVGPGRASSQAPAHCVDRRPATC